jgi:hypothetical protein
MLDGTKPQLTGLSAVSVFDRDVTALCLAFLNDSKHTIVEPLLARYYDDILNNKPNAGQSFCDAVKAVTAFFVLWRSVYGTNGLPETYRKFMVEHASYTTRLDNNELHNSDISTLKDVLRAKLESGLQGGISRNMLDREYWSNKAKTQISYKKMKEICRFILILTSHDTILDSTSPGLLIESASGYQRYATQEHWLAKELKSVEHIAPQTPGLNKDVVTNWDAKLYEESSLFDTIGNLVLMPLPLNISASNSVWSTKWIYYNYLALGAPDLRDDFENTVQSSFSITLDRNILKSLKSAKYAGHMNHIVAVGREGTWSADLVERRTDRVLSILHKRLLEWLN